jgi:hypothetical protein
MGLQGELGIHQSQPEEATALSAAQLQFWLACLLVLDYYLYFVKQAVLVGSISDPYALSQIAAMKLGFNKNQLQMLKAQAFGAPGTDNVVVLKA